jgi:hypothetical protein
MKKIITTVLIFVLICVVLNNTNAQTDNPILPRIYEDGYSIEQIKKFALELTDISASYRKKLLDIVNTGLRKSGEYVRINDGKPLTDNHISWIYDQVVRYPNGYLPAGYSNTFRRGNDVVSYQARKDYYGPLDVFTFGACYINLDKPSCVNLLGDLGIFEPPGSQKPLTQYTPTTQQVPSGTSGVGYSAPQKPEPATNFVAPKTIQEMATARIPEESVPTTIIPSTKFNWKPVIFIGGVTFAVGTGVLIYSLLNKDKSKSPVIPPFTPVDPTGP